MNSKNGHAVLFTGVRKYLKWLEQVFEQVQFYLFLSYFYTTLRLFFWKNVVYLLLLQTTINVLDIYLVCLLKCQMYVFTVWHLPISYIKRSTFVFLFSTNQHFKMKLNFIIVGIFIPIAVSYWHLNFCFQRLNFSSLTIDY